MKFREVVIFSGHAFRVPQGIQRIDHRATHGWQLRYGGTKLFSDHTSDGSGAAASLEKATKELLRRIAKIDAPTTLQASPSANKTSDLPVGISGPILRTRRNSTLRDASLSVSIPRYGLKPQRRNVYIGTENTYTPERFELALRKAIEIRTAAEEAYRREATRAKRNAARALRGATLTLVSPPAPAGRTRARAADVPLPAAAGDAATD
jgi:hypothetical protein